MQPILEIASTIAEQSDADVYFYNGPIERGTDLEIVQKISHSKSRPNALLLLITSGGDAHAAYKIARHIQNQYSTFTVLVPGVCKSAGTLIAVGAHAVACPLWGTGSPRYPDLQDR